MKRSISLLLCLVMMLSVLAGCGGGESVGDAQEITWWIGTGEDATYYASYEDNPAVKYLETMQFNGQNIDLKFSVPVAGAELDNFNTLMATEEYTDLMDMSFSTSGASELYEDGIIWDLTPYVEQYMPNYWALINEYPEIKDLIYSNVNGEQRLLTINSISREILSNFMGFLYRRDWVAKYGKNPTTGEKFTYGFTGENGAWEDNVVFPNGTPDPIYISDWEWMFEIFEIALDDLGVTDGYCISCYFKGYNEDGGLFSGFGGGTPLWHKNPDGTADFGGDSETMRSYLLCMNNWYEKGWMDKSFAEHTGDLVYAVDSAKVHTGKVGMWIGRRSETGNLMDNGDALTSGIMVCGARQPINDKYGAPETQGKEPDALYQYSRVRGSMIVTTKVTEEELPTILTFLDYLYTREGGLLLCLGLTEEQVTATQDETYAKFGLTHGYREELQADGTYKYIRNEATVEDNNLASAVAGKRLMTGIYDQGFVAALNASYIPEARAAMAEWDYYENAAFPDRFLTGQFSVDESAAYSKVYANVDTFMSTNIPKFIMGTLDIESEEDWGDYCTMLNKYGPDKVTKIYQRLFG